MNGSSWWIRIIRALFLALFCLTAKAQGDVVVSTRHIYILYPGLDAVWGSYLFLVSNTGKEPQQFKFSVLLPKETVDFQGQENLGPDELKLGPDGGLIIDKVFPPGDLMLNIGFKVAAEQGVGQFTVSSSSAFDSIGLFVWQDSMQVEGPSLDVKKGVPFSGRFYDTYTMRQGEAGQSYRFSLHGVPEGRGRLWRIGWAFFAVLSVIGLSLAYLSRPKKLDAEGVV